MQRRLTRLLRSPAFLLVLVVVLIAAVGIVYAHWSTTAEVRGQVNTGNVAVGFADHFTNDDGWVNDGGFDPFDIGGDDAPDWDARGDSSADPSWYGALASRYDKDVAGCFVGMEGDEQGEWLSINIDNAYPSYYCTIIGQLVNTGNVPIKAEPGYITGVTRFEYGECYEKWNFWDGPFMDQDLLDSGAYVGIYSHDGPSFIDVDGDGMFEPGDGDVYILWFEMENPAAMWNDHWVDDNGNGMFDVGEPEVYPAGFCDEVNPTTLSFTDNGDGTWNAGAGAAHELTIGFNPAQCGFQLDPGMDGGDGNVFDMEIWVHVEQDALQNAGYRFETTQPFRNWNEFDEMLLCP